MCESVITYLLTRPFGRTIRSISAFYLQIFQRSQRTRSLTRSSGSRLYAIISSSVTRFRLRVLNCPMNFQVKERQVLHLNSTSQVIKSSRAFSLLSFLIHRYHVSGENYSVSLFKRLFCLTASEFIILMSMF